MATTPNIDMGGKTVLVTGANQGIGYETALALAGMGATVGLVCRNKERGETAQAQIRSLAGNQNVDLFHYDLASQAETDRLIDDVKSRYDRLDVLVNNAGVVLNRRQVSPDGHELTLAINHLAPFQLTIGLVGLLTSSAPSRVVTVSSRAHQQGDIYFDDLHLERSWGRLGAMRSYGQSKLANILFAREFAKRTEGSGIISTSMHPGGVATNFGKSNPGWTGTVWRLLTKIGGPLMRSPAKGAETVIWLATAPEAIADNGAYFSDKKVKSVSKVAQDDDVAARLWEVSAELTGVDLPA